MPLKAIARMIQTMLYGRRFFPYYVYNILGGIEEDGECAMGVSRCCEYLLTAQALALSTLTTRLEVTNEKPAEQREPRSLSSSPSSTTK
jgi:20S proteasome subunit beta 6